MTRVATFFSSSSMTFDPPAQVIRAEAGDTASAGVHLSSASGSSAGFTLVTDAPWLTALPVSGNLPRTIEITVDAMDLAVGEYEVVLTATAQDHAPVSTTVTVRVGSSTGCHPVPCDQVLVDLPFVIHFGHDHGGVPDRNGVGIGFTYVDAPTDGTGYIAENLDMLHERLDITTTAGLAIDDVNSLDNALGVGLDVASQISVLTVSMTDIPAGTGSHEQAGLWFGLGQDNYIKLVIDSTPNGLQVVHSIEVEGRSAGSQRSRTLDLDGLELELEMTIDPFERTVSSAYRVQVTDYVGMGTFGPPVEFFGFDAAGIDPAIGTRSFAGISASHRRGPVPLVYTFLEFSVTGELAPPPDGSLEFDTVSFPISVPTSLAWGPDDRLYATERTGAIHALRLGPDNLPIDDQVIDAVTDLHGAQRMMLGLAIDPDSTADNVILWVSHSSAAIRGGKVNSGAVTRVSGPDFAEAEDIITGLTRAKANHGPNSIHFGPDGKLYLAIGGNTGAGSANNAETEFGTRAEQPLSAAILVADVKDPGFVGTCANEDDPFGPAPCDVVTFATGLRNPYDFVFHSNGFMYSTDNGLGVKGSFPPSATPPCTGMGSVELWDVGGHNPGAQLDSLYLVEEGAYYGHPNPSRNECVYGDGSHQGVPAALNYTPRIHELGSHKSGNGIVEFPWQGQCGDYAGQLLVANYSVGDNLDRIVLSDDGRSVIQSLNTYGGLDEPLALAVAPDGRVFIGEYGANRVSVLTPQSFGCWVDGTPMPGEILDAAGAGAAGKLFVIAGKGAQGHVSTVRVYDPAGDAWSAGPDLPGRGVENPATATLEGAVYAFGGSTAPFSGSVANASSHVPGSNSWTPLSPMPTPRGGATAQALGGRIYVIGGMGADGASTDIVEVYDPANDSWSAAASLGTRRDNPGSVVLDGRLYVLGGGVSAEVEQYDPVLDAWRTMTPMVTPRHGAATATIGDKIYIAGGGVVGGRSESAALETFEL